MKKIHNIDFEEIRAIFSSSSVKFKSLILTLAGLIVLMSVLIFSFYAPLIWLISVFLLINYEDDLFKFIIINYRFLKPPIRTKPRAGSLANELINSVILLDICILHPDIVFQVNTGSESTAMKTYTSRGVDYVEIYYLALKVYSKEEFQAVLYHELGHIALKHYNESKVIFFFGYIIFIFLPICLPLFWYIGSYISRYHELAANEFSLKNDPNHYMLKAEVGIGIVQTEISLWKNLWYNILYATVSPNPSPKRRIRALKRVRV